MNNPPTAVRALTFDVFGTLTDWRTSILLAGDEFARVNGQSVDWNRFALAWRAGYEPAMQRVRSGDLPWTTIDKLHRLILDGLLDQFGLDGQSEAEVDNLNLVWHRLEPWPDVVTGLERLRRRYTLATLSNGNMALLTEMTKRAGMRFDCILSAELAQRYKPDPVVYRRAIELLGLEPHEVMMVAAHNSDLAGARSVGMRTAFVYRTGEFGPGQATDLQPDLHVDIAAQDLHDLADQLRTDLPA